jgi:hypothetical protein
MYWRRRTITRIWLLTLGSLLLCAEWLGSMGGRYAGLPQQGQPAAARMQQQEQAKLRSEFPEYHQRPDRLGLEGAVLWQGPDWLGLDDSLIHQEPYWGGSWITAGRELEIDPDQLPPRDQIGNIGPAEAEDPAYQFVPQPPESSESHSPRDW